MKIKDISGILFGTCVVYVSMAACSDNNRKPLFLSGGGGSSGMGEAGAVMLSSNGGSGMGMGGIGGGMLTDAGSMLDAMMDPVPDASADPMSGTRLKAKYMHGADGSRAPIAGFWYDSQRNEECSFQQAADGLKRCLPTSYSSALLYIDASCTQPIAFVSTGCTPASYVVVNNTSVCGTNDGSTYYPVGPQIVPSALYLGKQSNCSVTGLNSSFTYYSVGAAIPPPAFVEGSVEVDP